MKNAVAGAVQALASGLMLVLLYRLLLDGVGSTGLGLWSLLVALFGLARLFEFGLIGAGVKLTAEAVVEGRLGDARCFTRLAILGTALTTFIPSVLLAAVIPGLAEVSTLTAWELQAIGAGVWIGFLVQALRSSIDAMQRVDLRHLSITLQGVIMLVLCWFLVPGHGWSGLVAAFLLCSCATALLTAVILWWLWRAFPWEGRSTSLVGLLKRLMGYGVPFHLTTISAQFYDPVTKYFLSVFGTLADVGWYEMANRMVLQLRGLLISAMEALVPHVAGIALADRSKSIGKVYFPAIQIVLMIGVPMFAAVLAAIPFIAELWIGTIDQQFVILSQALTFAWAINVLSAPAYFCAQGQGRQRWNLMAHILIAVANVALALVLGSAWGPLGVVGAFCLALVVGSLLLMAGFHSDNRLGGLREIRLSWSVAMPSGAALLGAGMALSWWWLPEGRQEIQVLGLMAAVAIAFLPLTDGQIRSVCTKILRYK